MKFLIDFPGNSSWGRQQTFGFMAKNRALVSIFPVIKASLAFIIRATMGSLFLYHRNASSDGFS